MTKQPSTTSTLPGCEGVCIAVPLREAMALHVIEGNPFDQQDVALFTRFEREGLSPEQRRAAILAEARAEALLKA